MSEKAEKEMVALQMDHLSQTNLEVRQVVIEHLTQELFGEEASERVWHTQGQVTQCILFGAQTIRKNVILAMFKERLGMGPKYYHFLFLL